MYLINQNNNFLNVSKNITNILTIINKLKTVLPSNWSRINKNYLFNIFDNHLIHYNSPINLTYAWSFGSLAGICLIIQMISGIFLGASLNLLFRSIVTSSYTRRHFSISGAFSEYARVVTLNGKAKRIYICKV